MARKKQTETNGECGSSDPCKKEVHLDEKWERVESIRVELIILFISSIDETKIYLINWKIAEGQ